MEINFKKSLAWVRESEGGNDDDPADSGGVATGAHTLSVVTSGNGCSGIGSTFSIPITTS